MVLLSRDEMKYLNMDFTWKPQLEPGLIKWLRKINEGDRWINPEHMDEVVAVEYVI